MVVVVLLPSSSSRRTVPLLRTAVTWTSSHRSVMRRNHVCGVRRGVTTAAAHSLSPLLVDVRAWGALGSGLDPSRGESSRQR